MLTTLTMASKIEANKSDKIAAYIPPPLRNKSNDQSYNAIENCDMKIKTDYYKNSNNSYCRSDSNNRSNVKKRKDSSNWRSDAKKDECNINEVSNSTTAKKHPPSYGMIMCGKVNGEVKYALGKKRTCYGCYAIFTGTFKDVHFTEISNDEIKLFINICEKDNWKADFEMFYREWRGEFFKDYEFKNHLRTFEGNRKYILKMVKKASSIYPDGLWEFPKGWLQKGEEPNVGALREFVEETHIKRVNIKPINMSCFNEHYNGYDATYYVGVVDAQHIKSVEFKSGELSELLWCSYEEAIKTIPAVIKERFDILKKINDNIDTFI